MMMDLFFDSAPVPSNCKKRMHFHEFMLSIHQKLHVERQRNPGGGDALFPIARQFVQQEAYLLCLDEFQVRNLIFSKRCQELVLTL